MACKFNASKTKMLSFTHHRDLFLPAISMADARLLESNTQHLLGLTFSTGATTSNYIYCKESWISQEIFFVRIYLAHLQIYHLSVH